MKHWLIKKLGGYVTVDEAISAVKDDKEKAKILTQAVKKLFNTISADDILREDGGNWIFKGKALTEGEKKLLISEATNFLESSLWNILQTDVKYQTNKKMYLDGTTEAHFTAGKLWTFTFDALRTRLKSMSSGSGLFHK